MKMEDYNLFNKTEYKKQHFVPQLLQRYFSLDSKTIGQYHIDSDTCCQSPISNTAQRSWYYKANNNDKVSVELAYSKIENAVNPILSRINSKQFNLDSEEKDILYLFVIAQLMRTPKAAKAMGYILDYCINKGIVEVCREVDSGIRDMTNLPMQASISIPNVAEYLSGKGYMFVSNDTDTNFLISDNPACMFSPVTEIAKEKHIEDKMLVQAPFAGYMLYLPLGPSVGIICFDDDYYIFNQDLVINATSDDVKTLNTLEVYNAKDIILYKEGTFNPVNLKDEIKVRKTDRIRRFQDSIFTPMNKNFALTGLNLDEERFVYLINRYAIEKRTKRRIFE